jgi:NiFe hydrogenase small subunit HydA
MDVSRRDFLRASSALAAALGASGLVPGLGDEAYGLEVTDGGVPVVWLQGQSCSGCSVSLLNSISEVTVDDLLLNTLDLEFHPTLMAPTGNLAVSAAERAYRRGGYVLVVEGAIPTAAGGAYCELWPGLTMAAGVERFASRAAFILAVGTCACYGGMAAGAPNPTGARGLASSYGGKRVIKVPGCPTHPDWVVGTIASLLSTGRAPSLDSDGRPTQYFRRSVHDRCPFEDDWDEVERLGVLGCLEELGCKGKRTRADCPTRRWNAGAAGGSGINWCIGSGAPCFGCTESTFPDGMSPFYRSGEGGDGDGEHDDD